MNGERVHIGFNEGAPEEVVWSGSSYIQPVHSIDRRRMRGNSILVFLGPIILFLCGVILLSIGSTVEHIPMIRIAGWYIICAIMISAGVVLFFLRGYILKNVMINKIRSRSEKLFEPDKDCILVGLENAFTYDKMKLSADDFGLLSITPETVFLEMTEHRGRFSLTDLQVSVLHTGKTIAGVRLSCNEGEWPWSVVMTPLSLSRQVLEGFSTVTQSNKLHSFLVEKGVGIRKQSGAAERELVSADNFLEETRMVEPREAALLDRSDEDVFEARYQDVLKEIRRQRKGQKSYLKSIIILLVSLFIFFQLGIFYWDFRQVVLVLLVLFVHEAGHFLGMKVFGYKNVQMFFIPLMGAAVKGTGRSVATWKKAIVTLLGPLPGIIISMVMFIMYAISSQEIYYDAGAMFLILNLLNLLPIVPLDGGRFLNQVIFSRNRHIEIVMLILAACLFLIAGFGLDIWVLKILGFLNLLTVRYTFNLATATKRMGKDLLEKEESVAREIYDRPSEEDIPEGFLRRMVSWIYKNMPGSMRPKVVASTVLHIWERVRVRPPKWPATTGLIIIFVMGYFLSFVSMGMFAYCTFGDFMYRSKIVEYEDDEGVKHYKQQWHWSGVLDTEIELSEDKQFYHGYHREYDYDGKLIEEGQWEMGKRTGQWKSYDSNSLLVSETFYEDGKCVLMRYLDSGQWTEYSWEEFSEEEKEYYLEESQMQQGPDRVFETDYSELFEDVNEVID